MNYKLATFHWFILCFVPTCLLTAQPALATPQSEAIATAQDSTKLSDEAAKPDERPLATGIVFHDLDGDGKFGANDRSFAGVRVSNGREIVTTNELGKYELPIDDDSIIFVIKPTGFRTSLDDNNLPRFYYVHKPNGSPKLQYAGVKPTGHLPQSIDFPLYEQPEPETFRVILFGDPQPRNNLEVDYISQDIVSELIGTENENSFGVSLGDLAFDNLDTLEPLNDSIALIGIPWYNVIGNHDLNLDATDRKYLNETFERVYGPSYYSFDYGQVHFIVLDNIDWEKPNDRINRYHYGAGFGKQQLEFVKKDLALIPESQMVVLLMHCPITTVKDKTEMFELIQDRPFCVSISGHQHYHQHLFLGKEDGFNGKNEHHHIINVTISGSWWSGAKDERGIPHTTMADGAPNGYSIMTFTRDDYRMDFKAAGRPASEQMRIRVANEIAEDKTGDTEVWVNVYNGSSKSTVEMAVDDAQEWIQLEQKLVADPHFVELVNEEQKLNPPVQPKLPKPKISSHLWMAKLPTAIDPGTHLLRVRTTDQHGRTYLGHRSFRVKENLKPTVVKN